MSSLKYTDLENKDVKELEQIVKGLRVKFGKLRFELANKTLKNFSQIKQTKKNIARALTALKNPKHQALNPKQAPMTNDQNPKPILNIRI